MPPSIPNLKTEHEDIPVRYLDFDTKNPRFPAEIAEGPVEDLIQRFVRDERLLEIVESIGRQNFFPGEPLLVVRNKRRFTVVEGNRRLAALKLLTGEIDPPEGRISIENAIREAEFHPDTVPCLIFPDQGKIIKYLGFRHITGIKPWGALQKARYMQRLRNDNYRKTDYATSLKFLAKETGSKAGYLGQMLTALALYEKAELHNFYKYKIDVEDIDFSILSTALSYSAVSEFLNLESRNDPSLTGLNEENLKDLIFFLFVKGPNQKAIVGESRHLKKLAPVLSSPAAVSFLKKEGRLDEAFEYSKGPSEALSEALMAAERRLTSAWEWLPKALKHIDVTHAERAENIAERADAIRSTIDRLLSENPKKKSAATRASSK